MHGINVERHASDEDYFRSWDIPFPRVSHKFTKMEHKSADHSRGDLIEYMENILPSKINYYTLWLARFQPANINSDDNLIAIFNLQGSTLHATSDLLKTQNCKW